MHPMAPVLILYLAVGLAACAPTPIDTPIAAPDIGRTRNLSYGVIVALRNIEVRNQTGIGTAGGAATGRLVGGDPRSNIIGAIAGAIIGGVAGTALEKTVNAGNAVEFIIREDNGQTISVVQINEDALRPGERIIVSRGARTRLQRAAAGV